MEAMDKSKYLECERWYVFALLMLVGGFFGGYTYSVRGGIFCNAQTANFVLFGMALGTQNFPQAGYLLIPMAAYFAGTILSEAVAGTIRRFGLIRWDTLFVLIEMLAVVILGFIPDSAPFQISQIIISFISSMQYNTFRQAESVPMATTFCTNHVRQAGVAFTKGVRHRDRSQVQRSLRHLLMLAVFVAGAAFAAMLCTILSGRAVWGALLPLGIVLADLLYADLKTEKDDRSRIPRGH